MIRCKGTCALQIWDMGQDVGDLGSLCVPAFPLLPFPSEPRWSVGSQTHSMVASACVRSHTMPWTFPIRLPNSPVVSATCTTTQRQM